MTLTAKEIIRGGFSFAGQRCTAIKYVMGFQNVLDKLFPAVIEQMKTLVHVGDPEIQTLRCLVRLFRESGRGIEQAINEAVAEGQRLHWEDTGKMHL